MAEDVAFPDSLCHRCQFLRLVEAARTTFVMCTHPQLPKYGRFSYVLWVPSFMI